jgi:peptide/nickel transport system permease protein
MRNTKGYTKIFHAAACSLLHALILLFGVSVLTFIIMAYMPGDPAEIIISLHNDTPSPENITAIRQKFGLDKPLQVRYLLWIQDALCLDFGLSYRTGDPVLHEIIRRLPVTCILAFSTFGFVVIVSLAGGIISALFQNRLPDRFHRFWTIVMVSLPDYWVGLILILIFSLKLRWVPVMGNQGLSSWILPVLTLGLTVSAVEGRVFRAGILEILTQDYVKFAFAKGLSFGKIIRRHVIKQALLPLVSMWGILLGHLLGGAVIVESVFSLPGLGKLTADAVLHRDIPMIQAGVMFITFIFLVTGQITDGICRRIDPRIVHTSQMPS